MAEAQRVKIGLCGASMKLADVPRFFDVLEVQQTFYQPPADAILRRWRDTVGPGFELTMKAWQLITHAATSSSTYRRLRRVLSDDERKGTGRFQHSAIVDEGWQTTLHCASILKPTAILFQCPKSFRADDDSVRALEAFFTRIERPARVRLLWEPRGPWPLELCGALCRNLDLVHVVDPFVDAAQTTTPAYWRLHGNTGAYHVYSDDELAAVRHMLPPAGETYVMFNNIQRAPDAKRFAALLSPSQRTPPPPPPPTTTTTQEQAELFSRA